MTKLITIILTGMLICTGCASVNISDLPLKHQLPNGRITVSENGIFYDGRMYAELRFYFTAQLSENPGEAYLFSTETQHRGLAIYYEKEKELAWIFPEKGLNDDVKKGYFRAHGDADGKLGWAYDVHISEDGKFIYWKKPGLFSQSSYMYSVEHGVSKLISTD